MKITIDNDRFHRFVMMLISLSEGDFSIRIPIEGLRDRFQLLEHFANTIAVNFDQIFKHTAHLQTRSNRDFILLLSLDLDKDFKIVNSDFNTRKLLKYDSKELEGRSITEFLNKKSQEEWETFREELQSTVTDPPFIELHFIDGKEMEVPAYCQVSEIENLEGYKYRLTSVVSFLHEEFIFRKEEEEKTRAYKKNKNRKPLSVWDRPDDLDTVYKVASYVVKHSEGPLVPMPELAMIHGTNETKLRNDFKEYYRITPVKLHTLLRFHKVKKEIETSTLPLTEVAEQFGFRNYPAFVAKFRKLFDYTPRIARERARALRK